MENEKNQDQNDNQENTKVDPKIKRIDKLHAQLLVHLRMLLKVL